MVFTFGGCIDMQLLVLSCGRLVVGWISRPVVNDLVTEGLAIPFAFSCKVEDTVPVYLMQDNNNCDID